MKPQIIIVLEGGLVQGVFNAGDREVVVLDLDTESADEEDLNPNPWEEELEEHGLSESPCFVRIAPDDGTLPHREINKEESR